MRRKLNNEEFIKRAKSKHGDMYDYSKIDYKSYHEKITIICKRCGREFQQNVSDHLSGEGCVCNKGNNQRLTLEKWIEKANKIHNNKYDYSNITTYHGGKQYVFPICNHIDENGNQHGAFRVRAENHIYGGNGCPKCAVLQRNLRKKYLLRHF